VDSKVRNLAARRELTREPRQERLLAVVRAARPLPRPGWGGGTSASIARSRDGPQITKRFGK